VMLHAVLQSSATKFRSQAKINWEQSAAERLSERFQPCLILGESDWSLSEHFQPCLILAEID